ncbi:IclR family transcriptional regulator [Halosimplex sp. J119]
MSKHGTHKINSTAISFRILNLVKEREGAACSDIVDDIEMPTSTVHDHLQTLTDLGYLVREDDEYQVSMKLLELGGFARTQSRLYNVAESEIQNLALETGDHANLMSAENGLGVFLLKRKGDEAVHLDTYEGKRVYMHTTALGKSMLAFMDERRRDRIIDEYGLPTVTENTIGDEDVLREELAEIRDRGYATDDEERLEGIRCIGAPIRTDDHTVVGAVSITGLKSRMQGEYFQQTIPETVLRTANTIEVNMRHG